MSESLEQLYEEAGKQLVQEIPEKWGTAWLNVEMFLDESGKNTAAFYAPIAEKNTAKWLEFSPPFHDVWYKIWHYFKVHSKAPWTTATFILQNTGTFDIDLGYEDLLSSTQLDRRIKWEKKYLDGIKIVYPETV